MTENNKGGRKSSGLKCKVSINLTEVEFAKLEEIRHKTGAPITTIIRRSLIESNLI